MEHKLYNSQLIKDNHQLFVNDCKKAYNFLQKTYNSNDSTWDYKKYNIFSLTSSNKLFYFLFKELNYHIRSFVGTDEPFLIYGWLNFHKYAQTPQSLKPHSHYSKYHGYISIDPQYTTTIFKKGFEIKNKIGQIYLGPGNEKIQSHDPYAHYVKNDAPYSNPRITIGFNIEGVYNQVITSPGIPLI